MVDSDRPPGMFKLPYLFGDPPFPRRKTNSKKQSVINEVDISELSPPSINNTPQPPKTSWAAVLGPNGSAKSPAVNPFAIQSPEAIAKRRAEKLAHLTNAYKPSAPDVAVSFDILPRGLYNTGNICFMNSILQALLFCVPFNQLLSSVDRVITPMLNSPTPLLDALIQLLRESRIPIEDGDGTTDKSQFGPPFTPTFFYSAMRRCKLFESMQGGHQEDAEEFLGFLLEGLHQEFLHSVGDRQQQQVPTTSNNNNFDDDWIEVGKGSKATVTRSTPSSSSPISRIFGGQFRSVLSVRHKKPSVTLDPFQHVQLDISHPDIHSVQQALVHLAKPENIPWRDPVSGNEVQATKETFIENLPNVLVLHIKRFEFTALNDNTIANSSFGIQKITKPISFDKELVIPQEALSLTLAKQSAQQPPTYQLCGVVYHHGYSVEGGHYTADVLNQKNNQWINIDDISLKTSEIFDQSLKVNGHHMNGRPDQHTANGYESDNSDRTAYLLFYQRI